MEDQKGEIRIYVACLAAYNNGILHGRWIDATLGEEHIRKGIRAMLEASPVPDAEEYAIHDYEGFEGAPIVEYQGIESVAEIAVFIEEHGALGGKLIEYFGDVGVAREAMEESYYGEYKRLEDFVQESIENQCEIPEQVRYYIDYQSMAHDWAISDILAIETGFEEVHVFSAG